MKTKEDSKIIQSVISRFTQGSDSMTIVYAKEPFPTKVTKSIFLAGPTPRDSKVASWRPEALQQLRDLGFDGHVFVPEDRSGTFRGSYVDQVTWEETALNQADIIVFWVPREMGSLPALTTNVEWGVWADSGKVVLGYPSGAESMKYLQHMADKLKVPAVQSLPDVLTRALEILGEGSLRIGGEVKVPLLVWKNPVFQGWYASQKSAGNQLRDAKLLWTFRCGPQRDKVFFWALHVDVWIKSENRVKSNEVLLSRSDLSACVLYYGEQVVLVREFRSPVRNEAGFVYELPGGSSAKENEDPLDVISHEVEEETGLKIDPIRFTQHGFRQASATMSAHGVNLFSAELSRKELSQVLSDYGNVHGVKEDSERTFVEVWSVSAIRDQQLVDWSNLGMILSVLGC